MVPSISVSLPHSSSTTTSSSSSSSSHCGSKPRLPLAPRPADEEEAVAETLRVMRRNEETTYDRRGFVLSEIEGIWRKILLDWMAYVVDQCGLQRQAVAAASYFLDVAMVRGLIATREEHQLAAAAALQLALKLFDSTVIRIEKLVKLGRGLFTADDVATMEGLILRAIGWRCHPPSAYCFLRQYERLLPSVVSGGARAALERVTGLVAELVVAEERYNRYKPSVVAYAAILLAMELLDHSELPVPARHCFVVRCSLVAGIRSHSAEVLAAFEDLKETLDASDRLEGLIADLDRAKERRELPPRSPVVPPKTKTAASPRHVSSCGHRSRSPAERAVPRERASR